MKPLLLILCGGAVVKSAAVLSHAVCPSEDPVVNGAFYGYPNNPSYAPWSLTHVSGGPGCEYVNGYTPCLADGGFGASDPNCLYGFHDDTLRCALNEDTANGSLWYTVLALSVLPEGLTVSIKRSN